MVLERDNHRKCKGEKYHEEGMGRLLFTFLIKPLDGSINVLYFFLRTKREEFSIHKQTSEP